MLERRPAVRLLKALDEGFIEPLAAEKTNHLYRLICERTFHPVFCIVLRVEPDGTGVLTAKMLSQDQEKIVEQHKTLAQPAKVEQLVTLVQQAGFWNLAPGQPFSEIGNDGSQWTLEAVHAGRYHRVGRWTPREETPVGRIGRRLIELADWKIERIY